MSKRSLARLRGAIKLVPDTDCIGVAVFSAKDMNHELIAVMDADLNIIRFEDFYNEDGYSISYLEERAPEYSIGYSCPLPVWIAGKLEMIAAIGIHLTLTTCSQAQVLIPAH